MTGVHVGRGSFFMELEEVALEIGWQFAESSDGALEYLYCQT